MTFITVLSVLLALVSIVCLLLGILYFSEPKTATIKKFFKRFLFGWDYNKQAFFLLPTLGIFRNYNCIDVTFSFAGLSLFVLYSKHFPNN